MMVSAKNGARLTERLAIAAFSDGYSEAELGRLAFSLIVFGQDVQVGDEFTVYFEKVKPS